MTAEFLICLLLMSIVLGGSSATNDKKHIKKILKLFTNSSANLVIKGKNKSSKEVLKLTASISSSCHLIDQEFGPQARQAPHRHPDHQAWSQLLDNHQNNHSQWVMTGYSLRMGPPQAHEKNALARAEEVQRILDRRRLST
ncbi:hypothetical protein K5F93_17750 [Pseudomonas protegens]|uniref:hypothetical protein n=1 Tax=Pseudomonas protegens TaxID=380021 RepID=UPI001C8E914E|nr:hypothetical protein [Pseudomonas protegens]QZI68270.1 hypothetical protein K5F93_17750 [Pseudomonas protegens]